MLLFAAVIISIASNNNGLKPLLIKGQQSAVSCELKINPT